MNGVVKVAKFLSLVCVYRMFFCNIYELFMPMLNKHSIVMMHLVKVEYENYNTMSCGISLVL